MSEPATGRHRCSRKFGVDGVDVAAVAAILQDVKELITIKAVGESCQDLALTHAVADCEAGRNFSTETDIGELLDVHEDDEPQKDGAELERHLVEEEGELANIEGLALIHRAAKDIRSVSEEVTGGLDNGPGAHVGGDVGLVGELEIVKSKSLAKEADHNPVKLFQNERCYANTSVVLRHIYAPKLVFDDRHKC